MLEEGHLLLSLHLDLGRAEPQASGTTEGEGTSVSEAATSPARPARAWKDNEALYLQTPPARGFPAPVEHKSNMSVSKR